MQQVSSVDVHFIVQELQNLKGAKIVKIYQYSIKELMFQLHIPGTGTRFLYIFLPHALFLSEERIPSLEQPPMFCMVLRKHLTNARIQGVKQIQSERVVEIEISTKAGTFFLMVEVFSKGNFIVCDENKKIILPMESITWRARALKRGEPYISPIGCDTIALSEEEFMTTIQTSTRDNISTILAVDLGVGGDYAEEICVRADIDPKAPQEKCDLKKIYTTWKDLLASKIRATITDGMATPFPFQKEKQKEMESFNAALSEIELADKEKAPSPGQQKQDKQSHILKTQQEQLIVFKKDIQENQQKAELMYERYPELQEVFAIVQEKKQGWKAKLVKHPLVKKFNEKDQTVEVEL